MAEVQSRPVALRVAKWAGIALAAILALLLLVLVGLNTGPGKRFVARQIAGFTTESGLNLRVASIDGSLYGRMVLHGLEVRDPRGVFLTSPAITVDWRPLAYVRSKIDVRSATAREIRLLRLPEMKPVPTDPNAPIIPDIDLALGELRVDRFIVEPPVTGKRHIVRMVGNAAIADRRAQVRADATALVAPGVAGGDKLRLVLDAVPDDNRLQIDARVEAPAGGLVDSYAALGRPLTFAITGKGDWAAWNGRATGTLGGQPLADVALTARNGTFRALGEARPAGLLSGPSARMFEPALKIDATAALDERRANTNIKLASDAFTVAARGLVDLGRNRFGDFRLDARLLKPGAIADNLGGRDVALTAVIDGEFATPTIAYRLSAAQIAFGTTGVEALLAEGKATVDAKRILIPVHATARRVTGLNAAAGGLVTNLRLDGDLAYTDGKLISDNLRLRSDRIDATALILADPANGTYTGALKGRVNDYDVTGLGRINLTTDARLVTAPGGGFGIKGHVTVLTKKITNEAIAGQLGGNAVITADVGYDPKAGATLSNLRMNAPDFRILSGEGGYDLASGALRFRAEAWSRTYGPAALRATGTIERPVVNLTAPRPGVGIGLVDLTAVLTGSAAGYDVKAKGGSDYGPFTADILIRSKQGPLTIDVRQLLVAGVGARGTLTQTAAGPFSGALAINGSGLDGRVMLSAAGSNQKADANITANGARLPGEPPITIGSGLIRGTMVMLPAGPSINGSAALTDVRQGTLLVRSARGKIDYQGGRGQAGFTVAGTSGVPFDLAGQAAFAPDRITANVKGSANGIAFHLAEPAVVTVEGGDYLLQPATIILPQGRVQVNGRYGSRTEAHAKLDGVDLSIAQAFAPTLGLGGKATGDVDLVMRGSNIPEARARIDIAAFTRSGALVVSDPVDVALLGTLGDAGGDMRALIRRGGKTIGRLQARLAPVGGEGEWSSRLAAAPISGGIRYNGPAEVLWTLTGIAGQTLSGPVAVGADFSGRLDAPQINGVIRASQLRYENEAFGTTITDIALDGRFSQSRFQLVNMTGRAGPGSLKASGYVGFDAASGFPMDIQATLDHARLAQSDALGASVSGTLAVTNSQAVGGLIKGDLRLHEARYQIIRDDSAQIVELTGVRRKGAPPPSPGQQGPAPSNWKLDIRLRADNQIFVSGMGLESEWQTNMRIGGTTGAPTVIGRLQVVRGTYSFAGRELQLDNASTIRFNGPMFDPDLSITASTAIEDISAIINIGGTAMHPQFTFTSTPTLPQDEVLSRLMFGSDLSSLTPIQAVQLAAALNSLRGTGGGLNPIGKLRGGTGLDRLRVLGGDEAEGRGTSLAAGKYISNDIYVEVVTDAKGFTQTQLTVALSRALSILSQAGGILGPSVTVRYSKQY